MAPEGTGPHADHGVYGISTAAELVGLGPQTLRLYEARGLVEPTRTAGGTRRYSANDLDRLRRIAELLGAGLNLAGIGMVLDLEVVNARLQAELSSSTLASVGDAKRATIAAYEADAAAYAAGTAALTSGLPEIDAFAARLPAGALVLEIGSGPGRDARWLEERGLRVRRTDITAAFVDLMRADGFTADVLDPLVDDLGGPYDGVWASAVLLHLQRVEMPVVLARLHGATRVGGVLGLSVKDGDGDAWSVHGHIGAPRHFTYWREEPLRAALESSGWRVERLARHVGQRDDWLDVFATAA